MISEELILFLVLAVGVALWWGGQRAREQASHYARQRCQEVGVIFLDDTVALTRFRLRRHTDGKVRFYRKYTFEFSGDGDRRVRGEVTVFGGRVTRCEMDAYPV